MKISSTFHVFEMTLTPIDKQIMLLVHTLTTEIFAKSMWNLPHHMKEDL